jgi:hypothetical protein
MIAYLGCCEIEEHQSENTRCDLLRNSTIVPDATSEAQPPPYDWRKFLILARAIWVPKPPQLTSRPWSFGGQGNDFVRPGWSERRVKGTSGGSPFPVPTWFLL